MRRILDQKRQPGVSGRAPAPRPRQGLATRLLALFALAVAGVASASDERVLEQFARGGQVLLLRHALAPGTGDPPGFRTGDCATQRNLDARGRAQARAIGDRLRDAGISRARVYSSQWCRCLETARLLDLGDVLDLPALNSFFGRYEERDARIDALRDFLARQPVDGPPLVLVTHQVTISALTGQGIGSGEAALFRLNGSRAPAFLTTVFDATR